MKIGPSVKQLKIGDHVQSAKGGLGTWRELGNHPESHVFRIDVDGLSAEAAATIQVSCGRLFGEESEDMLPKKKLGFLLQKRAKSRVSS